MRPFGFTLIDLLITLVVVAILVTVGIPSFFKQIQQSHVKTATLGLLEAIELTRTQAVFSNSRATIAKLTDWNNGWEIFADKNNDGIRNTDERLLQQREELKGIRIHANGPVKDYVSYVASGESRKANGTGTGAFQAGTFTVCPEDEGKGYELILARGGRVRMNEIDAKKCASTHTN